MRTQFPNLHLLALSSFILLMASCNKKPDSVQGDAISTQPPETVLGISIVFDSTDPGSITADGAKLRARPLIDALVSPQMTERRAALRLMAQGFSSRIAGRPSKYAMIDRALNLWIINALSPTSPKPDRDAFVAAVNSIISLFDKESRADSKQALFLFLDLELDIQQNDDSNSLLQKWKNSRSYRVLTSP